MGRFLVLGDIHDNVAGLARALSDAQAHGPYAAILCVGDLSSCLRSRYPEKRIEQHEQYEFFQRVETVLGLIGSVYPDTPLRFVPGNHDLPRGYERFGDKNLDQRVEEVGGVKVYGIGGSSPRFGFPYEFDDDDRFWSYHQWSLPSKPETGSIILSHSPPYGHCDRVRRSHEHVGSATLRDWIRDWQGVFLCGHIHESAGTSVILCPAGEEGDERLVASALVINAGAFGQPFPTGYPVVLDYDSVSGEVACTFLANTLPPSTHRVRLGHPPMEENLRLVRW